MKSRLPVLLTALLAFAGGVVADRFILRSDGSRPLAELRDSAPAITTPLRNTNGSPRNSINPAALAGLAGTKSNSHRLYREVASLSLDELSTLARKVVRSTDPEILKRRARIMKAIVLRWAEIDPAGAWNFIREPWHADKKSSPDNRGENWVDAIFVALTKSDPESAKTLAGGIRHHYLRHEALRRVMENLPGSPGERIAWVLQADPSFNEFGSSGLSNYEEGISYAVWPDNDIFSRWAQEDSTSAIAFLSGLAPGSVRQQAIYGIAEGLAITNPAAAVAFAKGQTNANESIAAWHAVMHNMASVRPADAAAHLADMPAGHPKIAVANSLARNWAKKDSAAAIAWIDSLEDSRLQQRMIHSASESLSDSDPVAAIDLAGRLHSQLARNRQLREIAGDWFKSDTASAVNWLRSQPDSPLMRELRNQALEKYADRDPHAAAGWIDELGETNVSADAIADVARAFGYADPDAALTWARSFSDPRLRQSAMDGAVLTIGAKDPQRAVAIIEGEGYQIHSSYIGSVASKLVEQDVDAGFRWIAGLPEHLRFEVTSDNLRQLARDDPMAAARKLSEAPAHLSAEEWNRLDKRATEIATTWGKFDLESALAWAVTLPEGKVQTSAFKNLTHQWIYFDPVAASEWIGGLAPGPVRHRAAEQLVFSIGDEDPESAFYWASTLTDPEERLDSLAFSVEKWKKQNPDAALTAIEKAGLDETEHEKMIGILSAQ